MDQAALDCGDYGLGTIAHIQPHENRADMTFDRGLCDAQGMRDVFIALAGYEQAQNLQFARAQI